MDRRKLRLGVVVVAAMAAAEGAVVLLTPRDGVITPRPIGLTEYFSPSQLLRAREFGHGQLWLYGAQLAVEAAVLVTLVRRPPRWLSRAGRRHPVAASGVAGAALSLGLTAATLPIAARAHARAVDVGLATQSWADWGADVLRAAGIGAVFAAVGALLAIFVIRRFPRRWWVAAGALVVAGGAAFVYAGPVLLDPVFNDFKPLRGPARADVVQLARRAGVTVGDVLEMDASRRTTAANAYVTGLGRTKRVVVYDTLLRRFSRDERRLVLAHELGHVRHRDVPRGLLFLLLVAPLGTLAVARLTDVLAPEGARGADAGPATLPALALSLALVAMPISMISNQLSRAVEARADSFALTLTGDPRSAIAFERRIAVQNVADPDPPRLIHLLLGTHPTTRERIGAAVAFGSR